jgi:hypothetical protein
LGAFVFFACFQAWHDEYEKAQAVKSPQSPPIQINMPPVIVPPAQVVVTPELPKQHTHIQFKSIQLLPQNPAYPFRPDVTLAFNVVCLNAGAFAAEDTSDFQHEVYVLKPPATEEQMIEDFKRKAQFHMTGRMLNPSMAAGHLELYHTVFGPSLSKEDVKNLTNGTYKVCVIAAIRWKDKTGLYESGECGCIDAIDNPSALVWADCPFNREVKLH